MQTVAAEFELDPIDIGPVALQEARLVWLSECIRSGSYAIDPDRVAASIIDHMAA